MNQQKKAPIGTKYSGVTFTFDEMARLLATLGDRPSIGQKEPDPVERDLAALRATLADLEPKAAAFSSPVQWLDEWSTIDASPRLGAKIGITPNSRLFVECDGLWRVPGSAPEQMEFALRWLTSELLRITGQSVSVTVDEGNVLRCDEYWFCLHRRCHEALRREHPP